MGPSRGECYLNRSKPRKRVRHTESKTRREQEQEMSSTPSSPSFLFSSSTSSSSTTTSRITAPRVRACNCCREAHSACDPYVNPFIPPSLHPFIHPSSYTLDPVSTFYVKRRNRRAHLRSFVGYMWHLLCCTTQSNATQRTAFQTIPTRHATTTARGLVAAACGPAELISAPIFHRASEAAALTHDLRAARRHRHRPRRPCPKRPFSPPCRHRRRPQPRHHRQRRRHLRPLRHLCRLRHLPGNPINIVFLYATATRIVVIITIFRINIVINRRSPSVMVRSMTVVVKQKKKMMMTTMAMAVARANCWPDWCGAWSR